MAYGYERLYEANQQRIKAIEDEATLRSQQERELKQYETALAMASFRVHTYLDHLVQLLLPQGTGAATVYLGYHQQQTSHYLVGFQKYDKSAPRVRYMVKHDVYDDEPIQLEGVPDQEFPASFTYPGSTSTLVLNNGQAYWTNDALRVHEVQEIHQQAAQSLEGQQGAITELITALVNQELNPQYAQVAQSMFAQS